MVEITTPRQPDTDRGQVGIETLIIFIAMILVAAVAAGVLINTAGFLQNKASSTSQDSQEQVSNQVIVVSAIGNVSDSSTINEVNLTTMMSPGADEIDLSAATIEYIGPDGHETLTHASPYSSSANATFNTTSINGEDNNVLTSKEERIVVKVNMTGKNSTTALQPLDEGEDATYRIVTQSGSQYTYIVSVPESLTSKSAGTAVEL